MISQISVTPIFFICFCHQCIHDPGFSLVTDSNIYIYIYIYIYITETILVSLSYCDSLSLRLLSRAALYCPLYVRYDITVLNLFIAFTFTIFI